MSDSSIPPTSPPAPTPATPALRVMPQAPVLSVPQSLQSLPDPVLIAGSVISSDPAAKLLRIQTAQGEIDIESAAFFPTGTDVAITLYMEKGKTFARVEAMTPQPMQEDKNLVPPEAAPQQSVPPLKAGDIVTATLLPREKTPETAKASPFTRTPAQETIKAPDLSQKSISTPQQERTSLTKEEIKAEPAPTPPPVFRPEEEIDNDLLHIIGAQLGIKMTQQSLQPRTLPTAPHTPVPQDLHALLPIIEQLEPQLATSPTLPSHSLLTAGAAPETQKIYRLEILQIQPLIADGKVTVPLKENTLSGIVESITPGGLPIIRTEKGSFILKLPATIPLGSRIVFEAKPITREQLTAEMHAAFQSSLSPHKMEEFEPLRSTEWPALKEMLQTTISATLPGVKDALPTPTPRMPPAALLFLAALRLGKLENWLGADALQFLKQAGKHDLTARLAGDFSKISKQAQEPLPDGWKMISMPLLHDDTLNQMQFFVRRQHDRDNSGTTAEKDRPVTRFLVNLSLSRMGSMQLDGFIHKKQFDMILRTNDVLTFSIRQEIMQRFAAGIAQVGMEGSIGFQAKRQGWVAIEIPERKDTTA
jgi:hypothetical protein